MRLVRLMFIIAALGASSSAFAQTDAKLFGKMKTLAGSWQGAVTTHPVAKEVEGKTVNVTLRVTSMGNVLMHEMTVASRPDDPITMLYLDEGKLALTHFCDAGNRPRMNGKLSEDGNTVEYDFVDLAGGDKYGHMHGARFTFVDDDHHTEEWVYMPPGKPAIHMRVELQRVK